MVSFTHSGILCKTLLYSTLFTSSLGYHPPYCSAGQIGEGPAAIKSTKIRNLLIENDRSSYSEVETSQIQKNVKMLKLDDISSVLVLGSFSDQDLAAIQHVVELCYKLNPKLVQKLEPLITRFRFPSPEEKEWLYNNPAVLQELMLISENEKPKVSDAELRERYEKENRYLGLFWPNCKSILDAIVNADKSVPDISILTTCMLEKYSPSTFIKRLEVSGFDFDWCETRNAAQLLAEIKELTDFYFLRDGFDFIYTVGGDDCALTQSNPEFIVAHELGHAFHDEFRPYFAEVVEEFDQINRDNRANCYAFFTEINFISYNRSLPNPQASLPSPDAFEEIYHDLLRRRKILYGFITSTGNIDERIANAEGDILNLEAQANTLEEIGSSSLRVRNDLAARRLDLQDLIRSKRRREDMGPRFESLEGILAEWQYIKDAWEKFYSLYTSGNVVVHERNAQEIADAIAHLITDTTAKNSKNTNEARSRKIELVREVLAKIH